MHDPTAYGAAIQQRNYSSAAVPAFTTGDRYRNTNNLTRKKRDASPDQPRTYMGADVQGTRASSRSSVQRKVNYAEAEAFGDITDEDDLDAIDSDEERQKKRQKTAIAAFDDTSDLDDEVEKVLSHRFAPLASPCRYSLRAPCGSFRLVCWLLKPGFASPCSNPLAAPCSSFRLACWLLEPGLACDATVRQKKR
jgi:hypothetical protein